MDRWKWKAKNTFYTEFGSTKNKEAIRIDPNYADAYNSMGTMLDNEKKYDEAVQHYNDAIRISLNSAFYYSNKGAALSELCRREEAMECYKEAIKIDPNDAFAYNGIELILKNEKCTLF